MEKYLIVKAYTGSEWDNVDFAVIRLHEVSVKFINDLMGEVKELKKKYDGFGGGLEIYADNAEFFAGVNDDCPFEFPEVEEDEPIIMELPDDYEDHFYRPENRIKYGNMSITEDTVKFAASGKHTGEEFWTDDVNISELLNVKA